MLVANDLIFRLLIYVVHAIIGACIYGGMDPGYGVSLVAIAHLGGDGNIFYVQW